MNTYDFVKVQFPYLNKEILIERDCTIADACLQAGAPLDFVCGGQGTCGKCSVEIERNGQNLIVLGCVEKVSEGLKILAGKRERTMNVQVLTNNTFKKTEFSPSVVKKYISKEQISFKACYGEWEGIEELIGIKRKKPSLDKLKQLAAFIRDPEVKGITFIIDNQEIVGMEPADTSQHLYGIAIDLGTTTVAAYFYNLISGEKIGVYSGLNGQAALGADVLTRIAAALQSDGLIKLQREVIQTINDLIEKAAKDLEFDYGFIYSIVICGNTAMQHLFLGLDPRQLSRAPFTSMTLSDVSVTPKELGLCINEKGYIHFLPLIGGFVGADTVAAALSTEMGNSKKIKLLIDLGTNGELVIGNRQKMLAASAAAGPALEGAGIKFGMRGTDGAIERVSLARNDIQLKAIGDCKPVGLCGSGLVDLIAEMLKMNLINARGRLCTKEAYIEKYGNNLLAERLDMIEGERVFILVDENTDNHTNKIYISQKDIRALQLAKGAIAAAYQILLKCYGIEEEQLDEILVAGAFGNYIDTKQAQFIGLLPNYKNVPVRSVGNAAGAGVQLYLLSRMKQAELFSMLKKMEHVELASDKDFSNIFSKTINFDSKSTH